jgi:V/A-type H+/Na+-transporting ATPase subunit I
MEAQMLVSMSKLEIIGPREILPDVLHKVHELGCLHLEDVINETEGGRYVVRPMDLDKASLKSKQQVEEALVKVGSILDSLPPMSIDEGLLDTQVEEADAAWDKSPQEFLDEVNRTINAAEDITKTLNAEKRALQAEQVNLAQHQIVLSKVAPLAGRLTALDNYDGTALLVEKKFANLIEVIRREVDRLTEGQSHLVADDVDESTIAVLLVFHNKYTRQVKSFISGESINEVVVPENLQSLPHDQALREIEKRRKEIPRRLKEIEQKLVDLSRSWYFTLLTEKRVLRDRLREFEVTTDLGATDYTFIIIGWLPAKRVAKCQGELTQAFGDKLFIQELKLTGHDAENAPIQYVHSKMVRPFEPIVHMFGTPRYGTVDPVPLVAIFFPLFFGIILGDMAYALILLGVSAYLHFKKKDSELLQGISIILLLAGSTSFIFGFLYGEFFGSWGEHIVVAMGAPEAVKFIGLKFPFHRGKLLIPMLIFAISLGVMHIFLGLILGIINSLRGHHRKHALEKGAMIVALVGLGPIIYKMMTGINTSFNTAGWLLLVAAIPVLIYSAGVMGPIEILGTVANIVSYARIMAIGTVSVILAETANQMGGAAGNVVLGVLIAALIHALNLVIHIFTPSIHVMRLNFVEFFGKFYEPGGTKYNPFKKGGDY